MLDLQESEVDDQSHWLSHFPESCTLLESLNISCLEGEVNFSVLERLVTRCTNLRTLRLNRAVPLDNLPNLLRRAPQLVDLGTGDFSAEHGAELYTKLSSAFEGCRGLKSLSGFWSVVPTYLTSVYSACGGLTSLNLSYATIQSTELVNLISKCHNLQRLLVCFFQIYDDPLMLYHIWQFAEIRRLGKDFFSLFPFTLNFCELENEDTIIVASLKIGPFVCILFPNVHRFVNMHFLFLMFSLLADC